MGNKIIYGVIVVLVLIAGIYFINGNSSQEFQSVSAYEGNINIYKSSTCGCCELYASYFKSNGNKNANIVALQDTDSIKNEYGIPSSMESCHTTVLKSDDGKEYFVEGHVPLEAVEKLLQEQPDIKGIAIPGMPNGSPGMPGTKKETWIVYAVNNDGSTSEFMRI